MRNVARALTLCASFVAACGGGEAHTSAPGDAHADAVSPGSTPPVTLAATSDCASVAHALGVARDDGEPLLAVVQPVPWSPAERDTQIATIDDRIARGRAAIPGVASEELREVATRFVDAMTRHRGTLAALVYAASPPGAPSPPGTPREVAAREAADEAARGLLATHDGPFLREEPKFSASRVSMVETLIPLWRICEP